MKPLVEIFDKDNEYAARLCQALNSKNEGTFEALFLKSPEERKDPEGLLLVSEDAEPEEIDSARGGTVALLTEVQGYSGSGGMPVIFKYQSISAIQKEIQALLQPSPQPAFGIPGKTRYIGIASPIGGSGKTAFSLALGQMLARNSRVLYVDLEPFSDIETMTENVPCSLSDLLYEVHTENRTDAPLSRYCAEWKGLFVLKPAETPEDIYKTGPEEFVQLLETITGRYEPEAVLLEFGADLRLLEGFSGLLSTLYVPGNETTMAEERQKRFVSWARKQGIGAVVSVNPPLPKYGTIPPENLLFSEIGDYVWTVTGRS